MAKRPDDLLAFLRTGVWLLREEDLPPWKRLLLRPLKVLLLAARGFLDDRCTVKASALTFYSLLSVVPVVAVFFAVAKGFGFDKRLQAQLLAKFPEQIDVLLKVFEFSNSLLQKTKGGVVAGIGAAVLLWSVIKVLGYIEESFNDIWKVGRPRTIGRKLSDYLSVTMVCPLIFIMASSITVTMAGRVKFIAEKVAVLGLPAAPILLLLKIIPVLLVWVLFAFVFIYMPNTRVRWRSGILAAVAAGSAYQLTQWAYIEFQVGAARANAIYGSFAALPLFLAWMQISWLIVLFGSEISFAVQNLDALGFPEGAEGVSGRQRRALSLLVGRLVARRFAGGEKPLSAAAIANELGMPALLVRDILRRLAEAGLLSPTAAEEGEEPAFQPARDVHGMTVRDVLLALETVGAVDLPFARTDAYRAVSEVLDSFEAAVAQSPENRRLLDL